MKIYTPLLAQYLGHVPASDVLKQKITDHAFEVEEVITTPHGDVIDLKVLPDRAHDCLSHAGLAQEVASILSLPFQTPATCSAFSPDSGLSSVPVSVEAKECKRYMAMRMRLPQGVTESPEWMKKMFEALELRSINFPVDLTNYILQETGQPMHVFDANKIIGTIHVRFARAGESVTTLDKKEVALTESMLVIADDAGVLAIAGVKGGVRAEVDASTTELIVECASFDAISVRKTAFATGIRTDASKRFENAYPSAWAMSALQRFVYLAQKEIPGITYGPVFDSHKEEEVFHTALFSHTRMNTLLGTALTHDEVHAFLQRLRLPAVQNGDTYTVTYGHRLFNVREEKDRASVPQQIIGHIGRMVGYQSGIPVIAYVPQKEFGRVAPHIVRVDSIRAKLIEQGFIEIRTYHFVSNGEEELINPLAEDKKFIRSSLIPGVAEAVTKAVYHAPVTGRTDVSVFEIGTVVTKNGEEIRLCVARAYASTKKQKKADEELRALCADLGLQVGVSADGVVEVFVANHNEVQEPVETYDIAPFQGEATVWQPLSVYPHMVRDVAFFVSDEARTHDIEKMLHDCAGELCVRVDMFDEFTKTLDDGSQKTSRAYRFVFQAQDRTLTDDEVVVSMNKVEEKLRALGCEIR